jgi:hypothetical protein
MTEIINFQDILNSPILDIKDPLALPPGKYLCTVEGVPEIGKVGQNGTDCVTFNLRPIQAVDGVDPDLLAVALNGASLKDKKIRHRLFITPESVYRLKRSLLDDLGIEPTNITQMLPDAMNRQVIVKLVHQSSKDGRTVC